MYYIKTFGWIFLVVFFADHILPGIEVTDQTKLPHVGTDLIFVAGLGLLNSLIYPILRLVKGSGSSFKIAFCSLVLNFAAYGLVKFLPFGITISSIEGYLITAGVVSVGGFLVNFFEMRHHLSQVRVEPPHSS